MSSLTLRPGVLLVGHGTRSPTGQAQCAALAERLRPLWAPRPLALAFLELAEPSIDQALERLLAEMPDRLVVFPLLLFAAGHARRDIPQAVQRALERHGAKSLPWVQVEPLGCHPAIVELSAWQCAERVGHLGRPGDGVLLVGRGTSDPEARAEFAELVAWRRRGAPGLPIEAAFLTGGGPTLDEQLQRLVAEGFSRIVVQPHLLLAGELMEGVTQRVASLAEQHPQVEWVVTPPLAEGILRHEGQQRLWLEAVQTRLKEAGIHVVASASQG